jgi:hypothetical protein
MKQENLNDKPYRLVGTETVGSVSTNVYEAKLKLGDKTVTYRRSVGASEGRIYKVLSDGAALTTTNIVEYDPSIEINPPVP